MNLYAAGIAVVLVFPVAFYAYAIANRRLRTVFRIVGSILSLGVGYGVVPQLLARQEMLLRAALSERVDELRWWYLGGAGVAVISGLILRGIVSPQRVLRIIEEETK